MWGEKTITFSHLLFLFKKEVIIIGFWNSISKILKRETDNNKKKNFIYNPTGGKNTFNLTSISNLSENDVTLSVMNRIASDMSRISATHLKSNISINSKISKLLNIRPNSLMSPADFFKFISNQQLMHSNAIVYIERDNFGEITQLIPIDWANISFVQDLSGNLFVSGNFESGEQFIIEYEDCIHLRNFYHTGVVGDDPYPLIFQNVKLLDLNNQSLAEALQSNGELKALLKVNTSLSNDDLLVAREKFINNFKSTNNGTIGAIDSKTEFIELNNDYKLTNDEQNKVLRNNILQFFGLSEAIFSGDYTETQYLAYLQNIIEPFSLQWEQEFTYKIFSREMINKNNKIHFTTNKLLMASTQAKTNFYKMNLETGIRTINEIREMENLPPIEGGDVSRVSLNFVSLDIADEYQLSRAKNENNNNDQNNQDDQDDNLENLEGGD